MINYSLSLACHRTSYCVLKASGQNIRSYLQSQITQDISLLASEHAIYTAVLTPQGKMVGDMYIINTGDELIMIAAKHHALALVERLRQFSMGHDVRLGIVDSLSLISIQGSACQLWFQDIENFVHAAMPMSEAAQEGVWLVVNTVDVPSILKRLPTIGSDDDMEQARIVYGKPRFAIDWDASTHPMNANLIEMNGVSFDKGCYVGQEVTSRMHWRGGVKKKLYHVSLSAMPKQTPCPIQTTVNIGTLTSAALDDIGKAWGIAHLPIETVEQKTPITLESSIDITILEACHA